MYLFYAVPKLSPVGVIVSTQAFALGPILCIIFAGPRTMFHQKHQGSANAQEVGVSIVHYVLQLVLLGLQLVGLIMFLAQTGAWAMLIAVPFIGVGWWKNYVAFVHLPVKFQNAYRFYYYSAGAINNFAQLLMLGVACFFSASALGIMDFWGTFVALWENQSVLSALFYVTIVSSNSLHFSFSNSIFFQILVHLFWYGLLLWPLFKTSRLALLFLRQHRLHLRGTVFALHTLKMALAACLLCRLR